MFNKVNISKVVNNIIGYFKLVGAKKDIKGTFISPYGLYSKPKNQFGISFENNQYVMSLHDFKKLPIDLKDNDIILTNGDNYIYFNIKDDEITINTKSKVIVQTDEVNINGDSKVNIDTKDFSVNASSITLKSSNHKIDTTSLTSTASSTSLSGIITNDGIKIDKTHIHAGVKTGGSTTTPPI